MRQAGLFLVMGRIAAVGSVGAPSTYSQLMLVPAAAVPAYLTGRVAAFPLNSRFVFEHADDDTARRAGA